MHRSKPASGGESLKYYNSKHHDEFINNAKSAVTKEFNDKSYLKYRANLENKSDFPSREKVK